MAKIAINKTGRRILDKINPVISATNQPFTGVVSLARYLTHYSDYTVDTNLACTIGDKMIGGGAEIRMIADGSHTPTFTDFVKSSGSEDYSTTLNAINKVVFYYDGTDVFYSISILS